MKRTMLPAFVAVLALATPARSSTGPDTLGAYDADRGHLWIAASQALTPEGLVKSTGIHDRLRRSLAWQLQHGLAGHGLQDGEIAATDQWCAPPQILNAGFAVSEEPQLLFISALLLSDVAVTATLSEATPGFFWSGNPAILFALSDVVLLHGRSVVPAHALVPSDRLVIRGRVFCTVTPSRGMKVNPAIGDRVVLLGEWSDHATVRVGSWLDPMGHLALVEEGETLHWNILPNAVFPKYTQPPSSLEQLHDRVASAESGGLFSATAPLVLQDYGSPERVEFVEMMSDYAFEGCRVLEVAATPDQGLQPTRISCPVRKPVP